VRLVAMSGGQTLSFPLRQGSTLIGRHSSCHICIPSKTISRRHAQFYVDGPSVTVRDLGSSHGTFVNGQRIERAELRNGDVVSLGIFDLRFEAEGAAATYGHGTAAAADIVVTAQGPAAAPAPGPTAAPAAGPPPAGGPPLGAQMPPPAPTDFPEQPTGEETPADQSFMPAPYVPRQETVMGGEAGQPQLVVREGRWFLRDPATGREVEIAPRGAEGAAALPAEGRRPNTRLLVTVVAIAAVVVITFAAVILRRPPVKDGGPKFSVAEYVQDVDAGLDALKAADYAKARAQFDLASKKRADFETARLLGQYSLLLEAAGGDFVKLNKSEAKRYLESLENTRCPSDKAIAFAREQRDWIDKESVAMGLLEAALARLQSGRDSEEVMLEVRAALHQIPPDRYAATLAKKEIAGINKAIADARLARAEREKAQLKWADAITQYQDALPFIEDAATRAKVARETEDCRRYASEAQIVKQAQDAVNAKNYESAREALKRVQPGYYHNNAQRLLADIDRMEKAEAREAIRQQITSLYTSGAAAQADELARKHNFPEFNYIAERAKRIEDLLAAGKKAEDERNYREAENAYQQALGVEPDTNNDYNRRAQRLLDAIKARYPQISIEFSDSGYRKIDKDPVAARKDFDQALTYDATNERAKKGLAHLDRQANLGYSEGRAYVMATPPKPAHAKAAFERARDCAEPGSKLYQLIMQELEKLR